MTEVAVCSGPGDIIRFSLAAFSGRLSNKSNEGRKVCWKKCDANLLCGSNGMGREREGLFDFGIWEVLWKENVYVVKR